MTQLQYMTDPEHRAGVRLSVGDVVERHLRDGDRVVFNRQPSLHKLSVMVHRVKLIDGLAIAVSLAAAEPYNADFDGDEMNLHVIQNMLGLAECEELMAVSRNVMNPQNNQPCLSLVQDARVGGMLLTRRTTFLTLEEMQQCIGAIKYPLPGKEDLPEPVQTDAETGRPLWSGKQLVSMILPGIFIERRVRGAGADVGPTDPAERYILIENGVLKHGTLCKTMLGSSAGGIVHRICTTMGNQAATRFLSDFQRIVYAWLPLRGLSMGLRDCMIPALVQARIDETTAELDARIAQLTETSHALQAHMTAIEIARVEAYMLTTLTSVLDYASRLVIQNLESLTGDSSLAFFDMVEAGSKGNTSNVAQIAAFLGQQVVDGHRIIPSATSGRTLPMFPKGALSAAARGFVMNSYLTGMQPHEYFYHMQGGREGLVATAVQTAQTGYIYRSDAKIQETNLVQWDGSVRNAQDYIIEFVAGGDCMDATRVEKVPIDAMKWTDAQCTDERVRLLRDFLRDAVMTPLYKEAGARFLLPVNLPDELRLVAHSHRVASIDETDDQLVRDFVDALVSEVATYFPSEEAYMALELSMRTELMPKRVHALGLNAQMLQTHVRPLVLQRVTGALIAPGEAVGVVSAQSIGEPSTQFTLDAFHQAGLVQRRMTVGVPRLKELLHASKTIATPSMVIPYLNKTIGYDQADKLARSLQFLCVDNVLHSSYVQYDPAGDNEATPVTQTFKDFDLMAHCAEVYGTEKSLDAHGRASDWIVRLVLNRTALSEHRLYPEDVAKEIASQITDCTFSIVYSQPNMLQWVMRVRLLEGATTELEARVLHARMRDDVLLGGVNGIRDSRAVQQTRAVVDNATGGLTTRTEWVVDTEGSSLMKIATRDWADWQNTVTNDVVEVARTLGIVAARAVLFAELDRVISYDGGYVDARHLKALTATMTHRGYILSVTRHGINRVDFSVLQRASYEEPVDMIIQAAVTAEKDGMNGTCQAIVGGQKIPVGTGTVSLQENVEEGGKRPRAAAPRSGLTSRETRAIGNLQRVHLKRLREINITATNTSRGRTVYGTPRSAELAWENNRQHPVTAQSEVDGVLPSSVDKWSFVITGRRMGTNAFGVLEKSDTEGAVRVHTITEPKLPQLPPSCFRPSSPSELFDQRSPSKRPRK
jgi:DNA-directed RNA polymerase II subunit RPB1